MCLNLPGRSDGTPDRTQMPFGNKNTLTINMGDLIVVPLPSASYICSAKSPSVPYFHSSVEHRPINLGHQRFIMPQVIDGTFQLGTEWFTGDFKTPDGFNLHVDGSFSPPIPPGLQVPAPILNYGSLADVYNFHTPASFVGPANINVLGISFSGAHQFTITGLIIPTLPYPTPFPINGTARWSLIN
jgi:hypothetical protein